MCTVLLPPGDNPITVSKYITSHHIIYHIISYHIISHHISYHIISYHISYHIISHHIISYHIISYHISYHITSYHISYHIISYHIIKKKTNALTSLLSDPSCHKLRLKSCFNPQTGCVCVWGGVELCPCGQHSCVHSSCYGIQMNEYVELVVDYIN